MGITRARHTLAGSETRYWTWGATSRSDAPCVFLFHGITSSHEFWVPMACELAVRGLKVIAWDMPFHGESRSSGSFSLAEAGDKAAAILAQEDVSSCLAVGHSYGCYVVQALAARHPGCVGAAVMFDGMPLGYPLKPLEAWSVRHYAAIAALWPYESYVRKGSEAASTTEKGRQEFARELTDLGRAGMLAATRACYPAVLDAPATPLPAGLPVTLAVGEKDGVGLVAPAMRVWAEELGVSLEVIAGAGHCSPWDRPERCLDLVLAAAEALS